MATKALAFDISTKTGWAVLQEEDKSIKLLEYGLSRLPLKINEYGPYPWSYINASRALVDQLVKIVEEKDPDVIVIEETNLATKSRYAQKALEFFHNTLLCRLEKYREGKFVPAVFYVSSSIWRSTLGISMPKEDKRNNSLLQKAKSSAIMTKSKLDKGQLGIRGKVTKKHLAIRYVNERYKIDLKVKDNDIADAICLGTAFLTGSKVCDGN